MEICQLLLTPGTFFVLIVLPNTKFSTEVDTNSLLQHGINTCDAQEVGQITAVHICRYNGQIAVTDSTLQECNEVYLGSAGIFRIFRTEAFEVKVVDYQAA